MYHKVWASTRKCTPNVQNLLVQWQDLPSHGQKQIPDKRYRFKESFLYFFGWSRYQHQKFRENCIVRIAQDAQVFPQFLVSIPRSTKNILHWLLIISFCCFPTFICGFETVLLTTLLSTYFRLVLIKVSTKFLGQTESSFLNNNNRN